MDVLWFSILISSGIKWMLLKLEAGEHTETDSVFSGVDIGRVRRRKLVELIGIIVERPMYRFLY